MHHPFTAPNPHDWRAGDLRAARALAYDCVYNGVEVGGGSLRIHRSDMQAKIFDIIGLGEHEARDKFGWLLDALEMGAPPHGGMAFGVDRLIMLVAGAKSIRCVTFLCAAYPVWQVDYSPRCSRRDVIAFPKTATGMCLLTGAPGKASDRQLADVHMKSATS